jgi:hypothetical protein
VLFAIWAADLIAMHFIGPIRDPQERAIAIAGQSEIVSNAGQPNAGSPVDHPTGHIRGGDQSSRCGERRLVADRIHHGRGAHRESRVRSIRMRDSTVRSSVTRLASGRLLADLLAALTRCGLQTMCESGGMADAILIERL